MVDFLPEMAVADLVVVLVLRVRVVAMDDSEAGLEETLEELTEILASALALLTARDTFGELVADALEEDMEEL